MSLLLLFVGCLHRPPSTPATSAANPTSKQGPGGGTMYREPEDWPEAVRAPMLANQARGLLLASRDHYAWQATDRVAEGVQSRALIGPAGMGTYVVEQTGVDSATVHFMRETPESLTSVVRVAFDARQPDGVLQPAADLPVDLGSDLAHSYFATHYAQMDPRFIPKWPTYNVDVVPWSDVPDEGWAVYLVPSAADYSHVPLGGGYRVHMSPDGRVVQAFDALSVGVIEVDVTALKKQQGMFVTSVLTPIPDATYIAFANIWDVVLFTVTGDAAWGMAGPNLYWMELPEEK